MENSQFAKWYALFKELTPKTRVLYAPDEFRRYLQADGINVPDSDNSDSEESSEEDEAALPPKEFHSRIQETIKELNGAVYPKLNWSAPRDATWISPEGNMKCLNANDVYMLLKASDYCTHDLNQNPKDLTLVLREWFDVNPSMEFRCFVKNGRLVAITQRDMNFYDFLQPLSSQIKRLSLELSIKLTDKYPDRDFVFDIYIPKDLKRSWLIDINPWRTETDSLLFSWDELQDLPDDSESPAELRLVTKEDSTRTFSSKPHSTNHVPHDLVDMPRQDFEEMMTMLKEARSHQQKDDDASN